MDGRTNLLRDGAPRRAGAPSGVSAALVLRIVLIAGTAIIFIVGARRMDSRTLPVTFGLALLAGCLVGLEMPWSGLAVAGLAAVSAAWHVKTGGPSAGRGLLGFCCLFFATGVVVGATLGGKSPWYGIDVNRRRARANSRSAVASPPQPPKVAMTGAWSLVPTSTSTGHDVAVRAIGSLAST